jgi:hypothetical protein
MPSGTQAFVLSVGLAIAACGDDDDDQRATSGSARGTRDGMTADAASNSAAGGAMVRMHDGSAQDGAADASALDGGLDAALDGSVSDAMPTPMPIEDAAADARIGPGGSGGLGGRGGAGGAAAVGGF